jgi:hypothetical protein
VLRLLLTTLYYPHILYIIIPELQVVHTHQPNGYDENSSLILKFTAAAVRGNKLLILYDLYVDQMNLCWKGAFASLLAEKVYSHLFKHVISLYIWIDTLYLCVRNNMTKQKHLERKREYHPRGRWSSSSMTGWERVVSTWESKKSRHLGCGTEG